MKLLVVDDSECWREFARTMLGPGYTMIECGDGAEAVRLYAEHQPDWVLMDIQMEQTDGLTAARRIKAQFPAARIVFVTLYSDPSLRADAASIVPEGYVVKEDFSQIFGILHPVPQSSCTHAS